MASTDSIATGRNLVTGTLGFVGLHLARALLADGVAVAGLGRQPGRAPSPPVAGDFRRRDEAGAGSTRYEGPAGSFAYHEASLEDGSAVAAVVREVRPSVIYHLAAQSSAATSFDDPRGTLESNLIGTLSLLEAVRKLPAADRPIVVVAGSAEEYGPQPPGSAPLTEECPPRPVSPYAVSKAAQTLLCLQYHRAWDVPVVVARPFAHTGPGQQPRFAFPAFARQIAAAEAGRGPAEVVTGDLSPVRDYLHVLDVVAAYRALAGHGQPGEVYNICSGTALTMADGLRILVAAARVPVTVRRDPARDRPADAARLVGDNRKLRLQTGWGPVSDARIALLDLLDEARKEFA
ncbi:MAG: GDP-mannose 4,6-dehydratase [bacterium]|nr:GDP-mannose 4,6-dehydratase [bacterium]